MHPIGKSVAASSAAALTLAAAGPAAAQYSGHQGGYGMMGGGHWIFGGIMMVIFLAIVIALAVILANWLTGSRGPGHDPQRSGPTPLEILEERFARGEIDADEFEERKKRLSK